jgi:hypothetical protein
MKAPMPANPALIEKLNALSTDRLAEVEDFVDFVRQRDQDRSLVRAAAAASAAAFAIVWSNPEDDAYDAI